MSHQPSANSFYQSERLKESNNCRFSRRDAVGAGPPSSRFNAMQQVMAGIFYAEDLLWRLEFVMIGVMMMKPWFKCQGNETSN
jgi:hypothetical protein